MCPVCGHAGFLSLLCKPPLALPPDLFYLLPSLPTIALALPPAALLAAMSVIVDWLEQFPPTIFASAFRVPPPLPVGDH